MPDKIRIAVVGLQFGAEFVPIYRDHPDVAQVAVCDLDAAKLNAVANKFGVSERFSRFEEILASGYDAVHLFTPVPLHVEQTLAALGAGMHCACAVPMAIDLAGLRQVIDAQRRSGKNYMMMETAVYSREFLYVQDRFARGDLGTLTFLRGAYYQDLEGPFPAYWRTIPPMHYATHAVAPLLALARTRATRVCCFGSGRLRPDLQIPGGNTFPLQTAIFQLAGTDVAAEVTRSWFQTARPYTEAFDVYGDKGGFEWQKVERENPLFFTLEPLDPAQRGRPVTAARIELPDRQDLLPEAIRPYTRSQGHGGSHPHLVHEFVRSIVEGRRPAIDAVVAADWTAPGICAHESALRDGERVDIPNWNVGQ
ncbi:MAG: Gfo/Idh/MocA family oxidoreductase [Thermoflexales bacterium]